MARGFCDSMTDDVFAEKLGGVLKYVVCTKQGEAYGNDRAVYGPSATFVNYPTGKTVIAYIPLGAVWSPDSSFGISMHLTNNDAWASEKPTDKTASDYIAKLLIVYID